MIFFHVPIVSCTQRPRQMSTQLVCTRRLLQSHNFCPDIGDSLLRICNACEINGIAAQGEASQQHHGETVAGWSVYCKLGTRYSVCKVKQESELVYQYIPGYTKGIIPGTYPELPCWGLLRGFSVKHNVTYRPSKYIAT